MDIRIDGKPAGKPDDLTSGASRFLCGMRVAISCQFLWDYCSTFLAFFLGAQVYARQLYGLTLHFSLACMLAHVLLTSDWIQHYQV